MKHLFFPLIAGLSILTSCATSNNVIKDDAYYSPYDDNDKSKKELVVSTDGTFTTSKISNNSQYDYQAYYSKDSSQEPKADPLYERTETVTDTNGVVYTTTETYYDEDYATLIRKFGTQSNSSTSYYDEEEDEGFYGGGNTNFYFGIGYPYGLYTGIGWGYPYYSSYYNWYYNMWWDPHF